MNITEIRQAEIRQEVLFRLFVLMVAMGFAGGLAGCAADRAETVSAPAPVPETLQAAVPSVTQEPDPAPLFGLENILGLTPATIEVIFGEPDLRRREKQAEVWMYKSPQCISHLFFYENENGDLQLDYVNSHAVDLQSVNPTVSPDACIDSHVDKERLKAGNFTLPQRPSSGDNGTDPQPGIPDN
ncbi:hypothetical protein [Luteithermobacter gelatinilyticus]|uniref:hypothetical protein n=1 Tax=Luteithermobacter gelatinilyticus TaxID=2582913 RepID=UPI001105BA98|nr:hypothetical protein [Luteithermobacter gelatinilyticus]